MLSLCREYTFGFDTVEALGSQSLVVKAFDYDKLSFNDSLGDQTIPLAPFMPQLKAGETVRMTIELNDGQKHPGRVWVALTWKPDYEPELLPPLPQQQEQQQQLEWLPL